MSPRAKLTDGLAYGCTVLLCIGIVAFVIAIVIGWMGVPHERAVMFFDGTRLLVIFGFLFVAVLDIVQNRRRLARSFELIRPIAGTSTMLNLIRVSVIFTIVLLLFAAGVAATPLKLPYLFYDLLRLSTCLAWASVAAVAAAQNMAGASDLGLLAFAFIVAFTPVVPLHLSLSLWAAVDIIAALSLTVALSSVVESYGSSESHTAGAA